MSAIGNERNPGSERDFVFAFLTEQLTNLPGDTTKPGNPAWQDEIVGSITLKVNALREVPTSDLNDYPLNVSHDILHLDEQLTTHIARLRRLGQEMTATALDKLLSMPASLPTA